MDCNFIYLIRISHVLVLVPTSLFNSGSDTQTIIGSMHIVRDPQQRMHLIRSKSMHAILVVDFRRCFKTGNTA